MAPPSGGAISFSVTEDRPSSLRIDRWLWYARAFKTRTLAGKMVDSNGIRVTRDAATHRIDKPSFAIRPGDTIAFSKGDRILVWEIVALGERRGPAPEAQSLYIDHSPPPPPREEKQDPAFRRKKGAGRPTKRERRELDALKDPFQD